MKQTIITCFALLSLCAASSKAEDGFVRIKRSLAEADATSFSFLSIVESDIFERVDTTEGTLYICKNGRYAVEIGGDRYLYDLDCLYSYSPSNNQVTVEKVDPTRAGAEEISFLTRLDEYFSTSTIKADREYRLIKKDTDNRNLPDSMRLTIDLSEMRLRYLEYLDSNDESTRLEIIDQQTHSQCDSTRFLPDFPDSVETIKL